MAEPYGTLRDGPREAEAGFRPSPDMGRFMKPRGASADTGDARTARKGKPHDTESSGDPDRAESAGNHAVYHKSAKSQYGIARPSPGARGLRI